MKFFKANVTVAAAMLAAVIGLGVPGPALAVSNVPPVSATPYVAAFQPAFGFSGIPHAGTMKLFIDNGTIAGTYEGMSVQPDRFNDRLTSVTGSVSNGAVMLNIGNAMTLTGEMAADGTISGTAHYNGRLYEFVAKPGSPGSGRS